MSNPIRVNQFQGLVMTQYDGNSDEIDTEKMTRKKEGVTKQNKEIPRTIFEMTGTAEANP